MRPYVELPGLEEIVLEESFVLDVIAEPGKLSFDVDFVLAKGHPAYAQPAAGERECFRRGKLHFGRVERLVWEEQGLQPAVDASGERDYGHIDSFEWEDGRYLLAGDWGRIEAKADAVEVVFPSET